MAALKSLYMARASNLVGSHGSVSLSLPLNGEPISAPRRVVLGCWAPTFARRRNFDNDESAGARRHLQANVSFHGAPLPLTSPLD